MAQKKKSRLCAACGETCSGDAFACECGYSFPIRGAEPAPLYPWLGRMISVLKIYAAVTMIVTLFRAFMLLGEVFDAPKGKEGSAMIEAALWGTVITVLAGILAFVVCLGMAEVGQLLLALHRRARILDERTALAEAAAEESEEAS